MRDLLRVAQRRQKARLGEAIMKVLSSICANPPNAPTMLLMSSRMPNKKKRQYISSALLKHQSMKRGERRNLPRCGLKSIVHGDLQNLLETSGRIDRFCVGSKAGIMLSFLALQSRSMLEMWKKTVNLRIERFSC